MNKLELGYLIHDALRQSLKEQQQLLKHEHVTDLLPVVQHLGQFILELEDWYSDKYHLKNRCPYFLAESEKIENEADRISEEIWKYAPVSLTPIFQRIAERKEQSANDHSYPRQLRSQFNNFRLALMEQIAGARLLENNADLGDEVERILVQYLDRRLGSNVRVLRGGHIYDYENNRSGQIDVILTPANALGICPADTGDGKYNVMIDQVIAAISVTSRLTSKGLQDRLQAFQKIPVFKQKEQEYPQIKDHAWPLCFIVGAEGEDLEKIEEVWEQTLKAGESQHNPQMVLMLDSGYIVGRNACWPSSKLCRGPDSRLNIGTGSFAGLGLGWLETQIAGRDCILTGRPHAWIQRHSEELSKLELRDVPPMDFRYNKFMTAFRPIQGAMKWGRHGCFPHNRLYLHDIMVGESTLVNTARKVAEPNLFVGCEFEPRMFMYQAAAIKGNYCGFEEWVDPRDALKHRRRIAVFDSATGAEISDQRFDDLTAITQLQQFDFAIAGH